MPATMAPPAPGCPPVRMTCCIRLTPSRHALRCRCAPVTPSSGNTIGAKLTFRPLCRATCSAVSLTSTNWSAAVIGSVAAPAVDGQAVGVEQGHLGLECDLELDASPAGLQRDPPQRAPLADRQDLQILRAQVSGRPRPLRSCREPARGTGIGHQPHVTRRAVGGGVEREAVVDSRYSPRVAHPDPVDGCRLEAPDGHRLDAGHAAVVYHPDAALLQFPLQGARRVTRRRGAPGSPFLRPFVSPRTLHFCPPPCP